MEKKQTAVQWLERKMRMRQMTLYEFQELFRKALQMEREQIEEAYNEGYCHGVDVGCGRRPESKNGEQYYTQTF